MICIAYIIGQLTHGGSERQLYELVKCLDKQRYKPIVICLSEAKEPYGPMLKNQGIRVYYLNRTKNYNLKRVFLTARLLDCEKVDIVHSYLHIGNGYGVLAAMLIGKRRFIPSIRSKETKRSLFMRITDWMAMHYARMIVVNSEEGMRFVMNQWRVAENRLAVIHNGVDLGKFLPLITKSKQKKIVHNLIVTMIGKNTYVKNVDMVLEVAAEVHNEFEDVHFWLVGPELDSGTFSRVRQVQEGYVKPLGPQDDIPSIIKDTDLLILTSRSEGLPNVIMEAMAAGKPVVSTNVGGVPELIKDGWNGFLVSSEDVDSMAEKVKDLIKDSSLRKRLGRNAATFVREHFSVENMVNKTEELYNRL